MKKSLTIIALCASLSLSMSFPAFAENSAKSPLKETIAIVDTQRVLSTCEVVKDILDQLEKKRLSYQADVSKKAKMFKEEEQKLEEERTLLSDEKYSQKRQEFDNKVDAVQREVQNKSSVLDRGYGDAMKVVNEKLFDIIKELSSEKGFDVALPSSVLLYSKEGLDISDVVLKKLNTALPKLKVEFTTKP